VNLERLEAVEPLANNAGLVEELPVAAERCGGALPRQLVFGVRNRRGQIYRRITTEKVEETMMAVAGLLEALGFVDSCATSERLGAGRWRRRFLSLNWDARVAQGCRPTSRKEVFSPYFPAK
jgi:hypothetical protein